MMESARQVKISGTPFTAGARPHNDNPRAALSMGRSLFPRDAIARIYRPSRSVMTSGKVRTKGWRLRFEPREAPFIEPLMGYTGSRDTLKQVAADRDVPDTRKAA